MTHTAVTTRSTRPLRRLFMGTVIINILFSLGLYMSLVDVVDGNDKMTVVDRSSSTTNEPHSGCCSSEPVCGEGCLDGWCGRSLANCMDCVKTDANLRWCLVAAAPEPPPPPPTTTTTPGAGYCSSDPECGEACLDDWCSRSRSNCKTCVTTDPKLTWCPNGAAPKQKKPVLEPPPPPPTTTTTPGAGCCSWDPECGEGCLDDWCSRSLSNCKTCVITDPKLIWCPNAATPRQKEPVL